MKEINRLRGKSGPTIPYRFSHFDVFPCFSSLASSLHGHIKYLKKRERKYMKKEIDLFEILMQLKFYF